MCSKEIWASKYLQVILTIQFIYFMMPMTVILKSLSCDASKWVETKLSRMNRDGLQMENLGSRDTSYIWISHCFKESLKTFEGWSSTTNCDGKSRNSANYDKRCLWSPIGSLRCAELPCSTCGWWWRWSQKIEFGLAWRS